MLPASHISDIERGLTIPTIPTLRKISDALDRPLEYFLQPEGEKPRSLGMVINLSSIGGQAALKFAQIVEQKTNYEYKVRIFGHSILGTAQEQVEGLAEGAIHIYIDELLAFECFAELCGPTCLPYFFRDRSHYLAFLKSSIFEEHIYNELLKKGIRLLKPISSWGSNSFELLLTTEAHFTPQDLVGRKFRTYDSPAAVKLRRALGAEPVIVEWAEAPQAFKNGAVDTFLVPVIYINAINPDEFARNATLLDYGYSLGLTVAVNDRAFSSMAPDLQSVLIEAALEAGEFYEPLVEEQAELILERLPAEFGLPVIHPDQNTWRSAFDTAIRQICEGGLLPGEIYDQIQEL
jgi:TRAP-type C4-dicarboxylate transport system substrate-binding protein